MQIFADKLFKNPIKIIEANSKKDMSDAFIQIEKFRQDYYLLGYVSYDFDFIYNVGGAIVWDSISEDEWGETITKMEFLNMEFHLIETFNSDIEKHIQRMKNLANELGFIWNTGIENFINLKC